jgi:eukaryotic translation initiation factor 2C
MLSPHFDSLDSLDSPICYIAQPITDNCQYALPTDFKRRPGFNTSGKAVQLGLNSWPVSQFPTKAIYQYDIIIGNGAEKRAVIRKVWESKARIEKTGHSLIFDGNKLAWSSQDLPEIRIMVDLDAEDGRAPGRTPNVFRLSIQRTKQLDISVIASYLDGRVQFGTPVLEAVNFLDHLLREGPAQNDRFISIKRSFFVRDGQRSNLGGGVEVFRGVYQTLRLAEGKRMIINLDVANTCFWQPTSLTAAIIAKFGYRDVQNIINVLRPQQDNGSRRPSREHVLIEKSFKKVNVNARYKGCPVPNKVWNIKCFRVENAREWKIDWKNPQTKEVEEQITIFDYFRRKYNITLQYPQLPLVEMSKKDVMYPMEFVFIKENQRYPFKLDDKQTANMIKFAVSPPNVRYGSIQEGKSWLDWSKDKYLQEYGLKIEEKPITTNARLLPPPGIKFGNKVEQPGTRGRWDLRGKRFLTGNPNELVAWGIGMFPGKSRPDKSHIDNFAAAFARAYREHGGRVANAPPNIVMLNADPAGAVEQLHQSTGNKFNRRPQLLIFLVQDKNSFHYTRIKKSCDCRYGVVSQVMQIQQVLKMNAQYFSNVLMKVNAKLGGCTTQVQPAAGSGFKAFTAPTMLIGADVSHASPGSPQASMAALTVSFDRHGGRYAAACQTNGHRVEMISEANMRSMLSPLITRWQADIGGGKLPAQVYYMRDGVSEGQFVHVMQQEVPHIMGVLQQCNNGRKWEGKLTVVIASKRHHIRAFPTAQSGAADAKGNPLPGCLIERDCTTPNEFDFYLYSHIALQGTSRPVHYTILHDDADHPPNTIQNMIYEHCYQYMRSTTSVSLHPAVYYAHLASNRARAHEDIPASEGPQGGAGFKQNQSSSSGPQDSETKPLMPMFNANGITFAMWYI